MTETPPPNPRQGRRWLWGALGGGTIGFAVAFVAYQLLTPVLEASTGLLRELQGFSWNLVPVLTLLGAVFGGALLSRRR
jgi:hypothetical protein